MGKKQEKTAGERRWAILWSNLENISRMRLLEAWVFTTARRAENDPNFPPINNISGGREIGANSEAKKRSISSAVWARKGRGTAVV
jgi:hypothetical protein